MATNSIPHLFLYAFLFFFLITTPHLAASVSFLCSDSNFTTNSTYQSKLDQVLSTIASTGWHTGFSLTTQGHAPNQIFGRSLCLGYLNSTDCQSCILNAIELIKETCPHKKRAGLWDDECFVRYSDTNATNSDENSWSQQALYNVQDTPNPERFEGFYTQLMGNLADKAANSTQLFKVDEENYTSTMTVYGLVQCIQDLSPDECHTCLEQFISSFTPTQFYWGKQGFANFNFKCYIRTDVSPYFNLSLIDSTRSTTSSSVPPAPQQEPKEAKRSTSGIVALVVGPIGTFVLVIFVLLYLRTKLHLKGEYNEEEMELGRDEGLVFFDLGTLRAATNNFSEENKLGKGGFGVVYKVVISTSRYICKQTGNSSEKAFCKLSRLEHLRNELVLVAKLHHKNLVTFFGCCFSDCEKLLVYEYLCNTSLDKILFDPVRRQELNWEQRLKIIEGIGRGLQYLHEDSRLKIVHRDLKASNILLDADMKPKLSDFGLAKLFGGDASQGNTSHIAGTYGYMAPEYVVNGQFSTKTDVFSYGILVLEILTGQTNSSCQDPMHEYLLTYVWRHWSQGVPLEIIDRSVIGHYPTQDLVRCIHIGLLCVQDDPSERPSMASVLLMQSSRSMSIPTPSAPTFIFHGTTNASELKSHGRLSTNAHRVVSTYEFSELEPR